MPEGPRPTIGHLGQWSNWGERQGQGKLCSLRVKNEGEKCAKLTHLFSEHTAAGNVSSRPNITDGAAIALASTGDMDVKRVADAELQGDKQEEEADESEFDTALVAETDNN